jgi:hypothetical protein
VIVVVVVVVVVAVVAAVAIVIVVVVVAFIVGLVGRYQRRPVAKHSKCFAELTTMHATCSDVESTSYPLCCGRRGHDTMASITS